MSLIEDLQKQLQEISAAVARAERTAALHPDIPSVLAQLQSFRKMQEGLEDEFAYAANEIGLDICSYRIEYSRHRALSINAFTSALGNFQKVFTSVYDAVLNGPKKRAKISTEISDATSFGFGYTFSGSIGVVMTLTNDRLLLGETQLDEAMKKTLELLSSRDEASIQKMTEEVGLSAVRQAYQWANENAKASLGAEIVWQRLEDEKVSMHSQPQEIRELAYVLGSAMAKEQITVTGTLQHVNLFDHTFQMEADGKIIQGTFSSAISEAQPAQLPKIYRALLTVSTKVAVVDDHEQILYDLVRLEPATGPLGALSGGSTAPRSS